MKPYEIIQLLEKDNSRLYKEDILNQNINNEEFVKGCRYALDPLLNFGIKQIPIYENGDSNSLFGDSNIEFDGFEKLLFNLINRKTTGNTARFAVEGLLINSNEQEWNDWYRRILIKDLKCGVSIKTFNKILKKNKMEPIYEFQCQLAEDIKNDFDKLTGTKIVQCKLDGARVLSFCYPDGRIIQYSRGGRELTNFPEIKKQLSLFLISEEGKEFKKSLNLSDLDFLVLDGEVMSDSFQDLMMQIHRKDNVQTDDSILYIFDVIVGSEFLEGIGSHTQYIRTTFINNYFKDNNIYKNIKSLNSSIINFDSDNGLDELNKINKFALDNDYEGIMIKEPNAVYECKRNKSWYKMKPTITLDLTIKSAHEGEGRNKGRLGFIICEGIYEGKNINVHAGSGFSDDQREELWEYREELVGLIVEIKADAISEDKEGNYSLRFPRFVRFRSDVKDKINKI